MTVKATTRLIGMIGDPIAKARTPGLLNPRIAAAGKDLAVVPLHIPAEAFDGVFPALLSLGNMAGFIVTYPFKERCMAFADRIGTGAKLVGGLNAMRREEDGSWTAEIFDGIGLLNAVKAVRDPVGARVLLLGAGGAGRAIAVSFAQAGAAAITVADLDDGRAGSLVANLAAAFPGCVVRRGGPDAVGHDIVVNATPVGMNPDDGLPGEVGVFAPGMTVADIVPAPTPTALMRKAQAEGASVIPGSAMTEGQAVALLKFFGVTG
ncbi:shikimate dehydrogenase [Paracoccus sp. J55]|uniref:shikimate dehydrogenase family protein n=1 Tax=Paracoccus sp. J55 TaxID=935849 RepID=UPI0004B025E9|nr:hypothetical protein [Paracoccus sp. J55]